MALIDPESFGGIAVALALLFIFCFIGLHCVSVFDTTSSTIKVVNKTLAGGGVILIDHNGNEWIVSEEVMYHIIEENNMYIVEAIENRGWQYLGLKPERHIITLQKVNRIVV